MNYLSKHIYMYHTFKHTLYIYSTCTLASYPGGEKTAWYTLYVHVRNIPWRQGTARIRPYINDVVLKQYEHSGMGWPLNYHRFHRLYRSFPSPVKSLGTRLTHTCICAHHVIGKEPCGTHQQALLHINVLIQVVQTVDCYSGYDDTRDHCHTAGQENSLPACPMNVQEPLHHKLTGICTLYT